MRGEAKYAKPIWTICFIDLAACEKQKTGSRLVEGGGGFDITYPNPRGLSHQ